MLERLSFPRPVTPGVTYLLMMLYAGLLRMGHDTVESGLASIALALLTLIPLLVVVPNLLRDRDDYELMLPGILYTLLIWSAATLLPGLYRPRPALCVRWKRGARRFTGLTPNPQTAGLLLGLTGPIGLWLFYNRKRGLPRLVAVVITGSILVIGCFTDRRALFFIVAASVLYARMGRTILLLPVLAAVTYGLWWYATANLDQSINPNHISSSENTRAEGWAAMWQTGLEHFFVEWASMASRIHGLRCCSGFASMASGWIVLMLALMTITGVQIARLVKVRQGP